MDLYDILFEMLKSKLVPILAHPERYAFVQKNPNLVYDLLQKGVLMQSNYGSFIGLYGKKAQLIAKKLLKNKMIYFLGSDVHRQESIYPKIPEIIQELKEITDDKYIEEITTTNAQLVLKNKKIDINEPKQMKFSVKEKIMMNWKEG